MEGVLVLQNLTIVKLRVVDWFQCLEQLDRTMQLVRHPTEHFMSTATAARIPDYDLPAAAALVMQKLQRCSKPAPGFRAGDAKAGG